MGKIIKRFEVLMFSSLTMPLLDILIGILFMAYLGFSTKVNVTIFGSLILVHGLFYAIRYLYDGLGTKFFAIDLIAAVASVILGVFVIFNPFEPLKSIGAFFCIWMVICGGEKAYYGIKFMSAQEDIFPLTFFVAVLMLVMGVLSLFNPFETFMLITRLVGLFLICSGLFEAVSCMLFRKRAKHILTLFK